MPDLPRTYPMPNPPAPATVSVDVLATLKASLAFVEAEAEQREAAGPGEYLDAANDLHAQLVAAIAKAEGRS